MPAKPVLPRSFPQHLNPGDLMETLALAPDRFDLRLGRLRHLPQSTVQAMSESLKRRGQLMPVMACELDGAWLLVDGFVRQRAAMALGWSSLEVEVQKLRSPEMKAQLYLRNRARGLTLLEECRLLQELSRVDGLSQVEIGDLLERHKSWVCRRLGLVEHLSPALLLEGGLCELRGGCLLSLAKLPARNQEEVWAACAHHRVRSEEVSAVLELYRRAPDEESRGYVLRAPKEALALKRARNEGAREARLGKLGGELWKLLRLLSQVSVRVQNRRFEGVEPLGKEGREVLSTALLEASRQSRKALSMVEELLTKQGENA